MKIFLQMCLHNQNGELKLPNVGTYRDWAKYDKGSDIAKFSNNSMDVALEWRLYSDASSGYNYHTGYFNYLNSSGDNRMMFVNLPDGTHGVRVYGVWGPPLTQSTDLNWLRVRALLNKTHASDYWNISDGTLLSLIRTEESVYGITETGIRGFYFEQSWDSNMRVDWTGVRKYIETEPTYSIQKLLWITPYQTVRLCRVEDMALKQV